MHDIVLLHCVTVWVKNKSGRSVDSVFLVILLLYVVEYST